MEKYRTLRKIVYTCAAVFVIQLVILIYMVNPITFFVWAAVGVLTIVCIYLVRIALLLLDELEKQDPQG